eukprot:14299818-Alexandrium_andersonii.AAC.1
MEGSRCGCACLASPRVVCCIKQVDRECVSMGRCACSLHESRMSARTHWSVRPLVLPRWAPGISVA